MSRPAGSTGIRWTPMAAGETVHRLRASPELLAGVLAVVEATREAGAVLGVSYVAGSLVEQGLSDCDPLPAGECGIRVRMTVELTEAVRRAALACACRPADIIRGAIAAAIREE